MRTQSTERDESNSITAELNLYEDKLNSSKYFHSHTIDRPILKIGKEFKKNNSWNCVI